MSFPKKKCHTRGIWGSGVIRNAEYLGIFYVAVFWSEMRKSDVLLCCIVRNSLKSSVLYFGVSRLLLASFFAEKHAVNGLRRFLRRDM